MATTTWTQTAGMVSDEDVDNVESFAEQALASKTAAAVSETNAANSATSASTSASAASTSATSASTSAATATTKAAEAATSATNAATSATSASTSATSATSSATSATASQTAAAASETAAAASETAAAASEAAAAASQAAAATSATNAATSETNAATSATSASASATSATSSAASASTDAATATTKAAEAATSASNAATSETNAATSATNAATSETNAASSASSASTSATNAASSASAASASQVAAAASAASAANSYDLFDDRYLGTKTSDPTLDNDGNALVAGALYFNSTANEMRVYDGGNWIAASSAGGASILEYRYTATAAQTTFSGADDNANTLSYTQDNLIVTLNGVVLENGADYTATTGTSVVLSSGAALNDELNIIAFKTFTTADMVPASTGGTFYNNIAISGDLTVDTNTLYVDSTNNNVGIGTTSPNNLLTLNSNTANTAITIQSSDTGLAAVVFGDQTDFSRGRIVYNNSDESLQFSVNNLQEAARIDASGNLLVGTTNVNIRDSSTTDGLVYRTGNSLDVTNNGNTVAIFNRNISDGEIVTFRKGAADVGSIGTVNSGLLVGSTDSALYFHTDNNIYPYNPSTSAYRNGDVDLGWSSGRFKDLYLSGGVYLGGTGAANKLDDYEEGTWTPTLKLGATVVTQSSTVARYTKIGRQVTLFLETYTTNLNGGSGTFNISGLPFNNIAGMRCAQTQFFFQFMSSSFPSGAKQGYIDSNGADVSVGYFTGSSGTAATLNESHFTTASYVYANITYFTN